MGVVTWIISISLGLVLVLVVGVLSVLFGPDIKRHFDNKWLAENGIAAPARVTAVHDTGRRYNYNPQVRLELEVEPEGAEAFTAELTLVVSPVHLPGLQPGRLLTVNYDPIRPSRIALAKP